jgi:NADPH:quinone reductase-like Zn-dependent oxidoreductase
MRAAVCTRYGGPEAVTVRELPTPVPTGGQVLIRVHAATVGASDVAARRGSPAYARLFFGLRRPRLPVLGSEFSGVVAAVGPDVTRFAVGDRVFGVTGAGFGSHAEYVCLPQDAAIAAAPRTLDHAAAASVADATALSFLRLAAHLGARADARTGTSPGARSGAGVIGVIGAAGAGAAADGGADTGILAGRRVLVTGASGAVGSAAVQLARHVGAQVTAVTSTAHLDLVRGLGAEVVVDRTREDFTRTGRTHDVVFDAAGYVGYRRCRPCLTSTGVYLTTVPTFGIMLRKLTRSRRAVIAFAGLRPTAEQAADLLVLRDLADGGALVPVVAARYPVERIADAHAHAERGKRGNVVVTMSGEDGPWSEDPVR